MTRRAVIRSSVAMVVLIYPVIWGLGYQDHPWHYHDTANTIAVVAVIASNALHVLGGWSTPPVPRWITRSGVVVSYLALLTALTWDALGRPSDLDAVGAGVLTKPIVGTLLVLGLVAAARRVFGRWMLRRREAQAEQPAPIN